MEKNNHKKRKLDHEKVKKYPSKLERLEKKMGAEKARPELKCVDMNNAGSGSYLQLCSTTIIGTLCNLVNTGTEFNNRIGRVINMKSVRIKGTFKPSGQAGVAGGETVRVCLIYDRQSNGAAPAYGDVFTSIDAASNVSSASVYDNPNVNNVDRFVILRDNKVSFANTSLTAGQTADLTDQNQHVAFDWYVKLKDLPVHFKYVAGTIADISSGSLYLFVIGDTAAASTGVALAWQGRLRYTDE